METALVRCCTQAHKHSSRPPSSPEARSTAATAYVLSAVCAFDSVVLLTAVKGWVCTTEPYELMCSDYASAANNDSCNLRGVYLGASLLSAFPLPQLVWFITRMTELLFLDAATKTSNTSDHKPPTRFVRMWKRGFSVFIYRKNFWKFSWRPFAHLQPPHVGFSFSHKDVHALTFKGKVSMHAHARSVTRFASQIQQNYNITWSSHFPQDDGDFPLQYYHHDGDSFHACVWVNVWCRCQEISLALWRERPSLEV